MNWNSSVSGSKHFLLSGLLEEKECCNFFCDQGNDDEYDDDDDDEYDEYDEQGDNINISSRSKSKSRGDVYTQKGVRAILNQKK